MNITDLENKIINADCMDILKQLPDMQLSANVLSRKLNVVNSQLLNEYGIFYDNKRGHERKIILKRLEQKS